MRLQGRHKCCCAMLQQEQARPPSCRRTMVRKAGTASCTFCHGILVTLRIMSAPTRISAGPVASAGRGAGGRTGGAERWRGCACEHMNGRGCAGLAARAHTSRMPHSQGGTVASRGEKKRAMKKKTDTWQEGWGGRVFQC